MPTTRKRSFVPLPVLVLALASLALPALAQKHRAVRSAPVAAPPPVGQCHTFGLVAAGTKATYLTTTPSSGNVNFTVTWISDTPTQTRTTQQVQTAQGNADVETTLDGEIVGTLRALKHLYVKGTTTVPVLGKLTTETDIDFVPSLAAGPAAGWCVGNTWLIPAVTETIVTRSPAGTTTNIVTTVASEGEVLAVGEVLTVPGGTFNTVKYRSSIVASGSNSVSPAITWVSMERNIVVKQDTLDASGNVTSVTELQ